MNDFNLTNAVVYDEECFPNFFCLHAESLEGNFFSTWEISEFRDDRPFLFQWLDYMRSIQAPMIGFNNLFYDYSLLHYIIKNPTATIAQIYAFSMNLIGSQNRFGNTIWASDRVIPQVDLFKIYHFDNKAKTTNLKALQINMRSPNVVESAVPFGTVLTREQIERDAIPYCIHDVRETKKFAQVSMNAINFRIGLVPQFGVDVLNWNDTKIGENILIDKIGRDVCFTRVNGRRVPRQTIRHSVPLTDVIFPYIHFQNPEFQRVLNYMRSQTLQTEEFLNELGELERGNSIKTKGVFSGLKAHVGGIDFYFGTGGIHGSVSAQHVRASGRRRIRDIDVASLYPSIGIVNRLRPEHLGEPFVEAYASLPKERKEWQKRKGKKCTEANSLKLAGNGAYGKSNDKFSCLFDPLFTMRITINGQLMIAMLVEWLLAVPTLTIIQANTDGITYSIDEEYIPQAVAIEKRWQAFTLLELEEVYYSDMWIRDVNNYIAKPISKPDENDPALKQKGAYWHPEPGDRYFDSISESQPPAWHKDLGNLVSIKAAIAAMVHGIDPESFIKIHNNSYDFMLRIKVSRADVLKLDGRELQRNTRYYVAKNGGRMTKTSPPAKGAAVGDFKRANKIDDAYYSRVMQEIGPNAWDERIHTKNRSRYEMRETSIEAGWSVAECNNAALFDFRNVNYAYYVAEAKKLIISG